MKLGTCLFVIILLSSCYQPDKAFYDYANPDLGWSIKVPNSWKMNSPTEVIANNGAGIEAMEEAMEQELDLSGISYSLNFQKDNSNVFQSVYEPFTESEPGLWLKNNMAVKSLFASVYEKQGIKVDTTVTSTENISGVEFQRYEITMYEGENVKLNQMFYSSFLKGFDFGVCLTYNSEENRDELLDIWKRSRFD